MKNLILVSFVGVDSQTNLDDIDHFNSPSIPCEWSVLYSDTKSTGNYARYPSYAFCKDFLTWCQSRGWLGSLHLCGSVIERYLNQEPDVMDLCQLAYRIQLNLNIAKFPDYAKLADDLLTISAANHHDLILQQNKTKAAFMDILLSKANKEINVLYDGSGGFGTEITKAEPPNVKHFTGYAGGIKPDNVVKIVGLIEGANPLSSQYYIDMESGVRADDVFSVEKCRQVISNLLSVS